MTTDSAQDSPLILWLEQATTAAVPLVGGKAAGLGRLVSKGLSVPPGFVLTTAAYRLARQRRADLSPDSRAAASTWPLPPEVKSAVTTAYRQLAVRCGAPEPAVAVRSSGTLEDLPDAAFAGIYETGTGVRGANAVLAWVRRCWASLFSAPAVAYRREHGLDRDDAAMAVIVQRLIPAEVAGVAFTADPVSGNRERVVLNAAWGLGTSVVDGIVEADTYTVARSTRQIVSRTIGDKATQAGDAPQARVSVPQERRRRPCLDDTVVHTVTDLALRAEALWRQPVDVEWAIANGQIWLLQTRPATGLSQAAPGPTPGASDDSQTTLPFEIVWPTPEAAQYHWKLEAHPGLAPPEAWRPLEQDIGSRFARARPNAAKLTGRPTYSEVVWVQGYRYTREVTNPESQAERTRRQEAFQAAVDACTERGQGYYEAVVEPEVVARNARLDAVDLEKLSAERLAAHLTDALDMLERHWTLHWLWGRGGPRERFEAVYKELTGDEDESVSKKLLAGISNKFTETVDDLIGLARAIQASPGLRRAIETEDSPAFLAHLPATPEGTRFRRQFDDFLARWGLRCGMGFGTSHSPDLPCWREEPALVVDILRRYVPLDLDHLSAPPARAAAARAALLAQTMQKIGDDPARRERFQFWYRAAQRAARRFEDHNYDIDSVSYALVHLAVSACGRRLAAAGVLADPQDVWYLHEHEATAALRGLTLPAAEHCDWAALVEERRAAHRRQQRMRPPATIGVPPPEDSEHEEQVAKDEERADEVPALTAEERARLLVRGQAGSAGVATGRVRVIPRTATVPDVAPGDILVSNNAGPLWTPVFPTLAAVILDEGVLFQHAMGAAREYGIPGVLQTREATKVLQEGQLVTVDGNRGLVLRASDL